MKRGRRLGVVAGALIVAAALIVPTTALPTTALAVKGGPPDFVRELVPGFVAERLFGDVDAGHWAFHDITLMRFKHVFGGDETGKFRPNDPVTRIQLVCLALRIMGLEDEAKAMGVDAAVGILREVYDDYATVPTWAGARECLAYAYERGLLAGLCHQERHRFRANDPAVRLEVIVTLMEAMGLGEEAAAASSETIGAPDAGTVPDWARGHIALAISAGLLRGDERGHLNLYHNVRRSEMAALLARVDGLVDTPADQAVATGWLVSVGETTSSEGAALRTLTVRSDPRPEVEEDEDYILHPEALIFLNGRSATLDELAPGDRLQIRLEGGLAIFVSARVEQVEVSGTMLSSLVSPSDEGVLLSVTITVTVADEDGLYSEDATVTITMAAGYVVWFRGDKNSSELPEPGDHLELKIVRGLVSILVIDERAGDD